MRITKHHVTNLDLYLGGISEGATFRVVASLSNEQYGRVGLSAAPGAGDTVLPRVVGPVTRYNARGRWVVHRDLPKEPRYIRTVSWKWTQWSGQDQTEHEDFRDIYRDCYPRDLVPPPGVELTVISIDGALHVTSPELRKTESESSNNRHCVNLLLEIFRSCELVGANMRPMRLPEIRRANWRMLPPGDYPWQKVEAHIDAAIGKRSDDTKRVIWDRQETIKGFGPDEIFVGEAGFDDYLAYVFNARRLVVLESVRKDNAIYVFGLDWKRVSQLSKGEIVRGGLQAARIVHAKGWKAQLARLLHEDKAA
ncbi:protein of unknown function [Hyphomicrobium sp. 1Nfss2.1]|uniref:hypothetical protein n=1 Tax=Hyphomicrobium sp. 1Nfss2.1 TaxID=3413936 RepID=UPI003C7A16F1